MLEGEKFISLTTFRKTGVPVTTPVWFVAEGGKFLVMTEPEAGKIKRLRHTPKVTFAPCTYNGKVTGETHEGTAQILSGGESSHIPKLLLRKYGWQFRLFSLFRRGEKIYFEIIPN